MALLLAGSVCTYAQNYLGATQISIEKRLTEKGLEPNTYYNGRGGVSISCEVDETEYRIYMIEPSGFCESYIVLSNEDGFVFKMRQYALQNGFKEVSTGIEDCYEYKNVATKVRITIMETLLLESESDIVNRYLFTASISKIKPNVKR
jgi:hypothetical protein